MIYYVKNFADGIDIIKTMLDSLAKVDHVTIDTETTGLDPFTCDILLYQFKVGDDIFVLNRGKIGSKFFTKLIDKVNDLNILCLGHNIKFDAKMIKQDTGVWIKRMYDSMIIESVLTSGLGGKYPSLAELVKKYCNIDLDKSNRLEFLNMNHNSDFTDGQINYSALDVLYIDDIRNGQLNLVEEAHLGKIVELEMNVLPVVVKMERQGITLDIPYWKKLTDGASIQCDELRVKVKYTIFDALDLSKYDNALSLTDALCIPAKTKRLRVTLESITDPAESKSWIMANFNIASHKQLLTALNLIGIETPDTNEKTLSRLPSHPVIDIILEYRDYEKRISTYGYNVIEAVNPVTGRIHTEFNQIGTSTGRFSSSGGVNMQNIPTHNGYREGFVARDGFSFMAMDYSQQEYRLAGSLSKEPAIIDAYLAGYDMHTASAAKRYNKEFKDVTKDERSKGKGINFTVLYGGTEWALGKNLKVPTDEAKQILSKFFADYPRLTLFKNAVEERIVKLGYSVTPMGRRRYFKALSPLSTPYEVVSHISKMKREGFNMVIQGGGADVTKLALYDMDRNNPFGDLFIPLLQVHDEIVAEVHDSILVEAEIFMKAQMEGAFQPFLGVIPALVEAHVSKRWEKS